MTTVYALTCALLARASSRRRTCLAAIARLRSIAVNTWEKRSKEKCRKQNGIALTKTDDGRCSLTHAEMHVSRFSYLSSIDQASGVFNFFPSKTPPNNSMVVLVQIAP